MYYQVQEEIREISINYYNPQVLTVGVISLEELEQWSEQFGFSYLSDSECKTSSHSPNGTLSSYYDYLFGLISTVNPNQFMRLQDRLGIFIKKNLLIIVIIEDTDHSTDARISKLFQHLNLSKINLERLIYGFLETFIDEEQCILEKIENEISTYEDKINAMKLEKDFNYKITGIRKRLLLLDNYYQQFISIGEELEEDSADIFNEEYIHYFRVFSSKAERMSNNTRMLQEYSIHVREAYHAQLEYEQNRIMKIFTVVTTIFLPLTLIVGWYGMNFSGMPEITWRFGYLYVIVLCIIVALISFLFFKKKKFI